MLQTFEEWWMTFKGYRRMSWYLISFKWQFWRALDDFEGYWKVSQYFAPISGAACWNNWVCLFDFLLISNSPSNMSLSPWLGLLQWNRRLSSLRPFSIITAAVWSLHSCMWDSICRVFWKRNNWTTVCFFFSFSGKTKHFQSAASFPLLNDHS